MSEIMLLKDKLGYRISLLGNFKKLCDEFEAAI